MHNDGVTDVKKNCPECKVERRTVRLKFVAGSRTDWYGVLRWYYCKGCDTKFVTTNNSTPEPSL